jgi:Rod binding domain-containing protein
VSSVIRHPSSAVEKAKDFESLFVAQMLKHLFADVGEEANLFGDAETSDIYKEWMVEQYGKLITDAGGIGVADHVQKELLKLQEINQGGQS